MAEAYLFLNGASSGLVDHDYPNENIRPKPVVGMTPAYNITNYPNWEYKKRLYLKFEAFPDQYKYNRLYLVEIRFVFMATRDELEGFDVYAPSSDFDPLTITYNTRTAGEKIGASGTDFATGNTQSIRIPEYYYQSHTATYKSETAKKLLKYSGAYVISQDGLQDRGTISAFDETRTQAPRLAYIVTYDDSVIVTSTVVGSGKTSGYVNPHVSQTFNWDFEKDGDYYCFGEWTQASATFYWSDDEGSTWNSVAASGSTQSVTLAANTLPVGTIQWKVTATDNQGTTTTSPVYTINTTDTLATTTLVGPIDTVEANNAEITFRWTSSNASGSTPTGYRLAWRDASVTPATWYYVSIAGSTPEYTMPANTLPPGVIIWTVLTYNLDNAPGAWATQASFQAVGAPASPIVSADNVPFSTITWQSTGQQAWRVTVDGTTYGPYFGGVKTFTLPDYLADGTHEAAVEVQGSYGLWSQPGTVQFTVENVPGDAVTLTGVYGRDATLTWTTNSATEDYLVYRDGVRIGRSSLLGFTDRVVLGTHSWQVVNRLPGGYYTASNFVTGTLSTNVLALALLDGGAWLELSWSINSARTYSSSVMREVSVRHFAGLAYPVAESSPYYTQGVSFDVAWLPNETEQARTFESFIGRPVIYKSQTGEALVGVLSAYSKQSTQFSNSYAATIQRINWRDFVDADS